MKMLLNNGIVIDNAPVMSEKTRQHLSQFWNFPSKEEVEKEKDKYYVIDYKREWQRRDVVVEHETSI
jgi:hypothetical protein